MKHSIRWGWAAGVAVLALAAAPARAVAPSVEIYPTRAESAGMSVRGWGSGKAMIATDRGFGGNASSIKVSTDGPYAGGRIVFAKPIDVTEQFTAPDSRFGFLEFTVQFEPSTSPSAQPPAGDVGFGEGAGQAPAHASQSMRVSLVFNDGRPDQTVEAANHPIQLINTNEEGWQTMAVPFLAFKGVDKLKTFNLREIRIFTDNKDTFYIGEIKTITDDEPITVEPLEDYEIAVNDLVQFEAKATGGLSTLKFTWDFDKSDGIQEDAVGPNVTHVFRKPSMLRNNNENMPIPYIVTLTVSDVSGAKKPETRTAEVIVNR